VAIILPLVPGPISLVVLAIVFTAEDSLWNHVLHLVVISLYSPSVGMVFPWLSWCWHFWKISGWLFYKSSNNLDFANNFALKLLVFHRVVILNYVHVPLLIKLLIIYVTMDSKIPNFSTDHTVFLSMFIFMLKL
jgi:hypothetical protein